MSDLTPFDCRANHKATFEDILPLLLEDHLRKTGSKHPNQNGQDMNKLIADFCREPKSVQEIMDEFEFDSRTSFRRKYLTPMLKNCVLKMTIPEKPSSKNQKYFS